MDAGNGSALYQKQLPAIATLFTTHATSIGRSIAGNNKALYAYMDGYNGDQMAEGTEYGGQTFAGKANGSPCGLFHDSQRYHCPGV